MTWIQVCWYHMSEWWCIFFFKQKTAYEMRISDWSSDVCSSDLTGAAVAVDADIGVGQQGLQSVAEWMRRGHASRCGTRKAPAQVTNTAEIGRAACRERVCQYV